MPKPRLSKIGQLLSMGVEGVAQLLGKQGITVDANPNTRIDNEAIDALIAQIGDYDLRRKLEEVKDRPRGAAPAAPTVTSEASTPAVAEPSRAENPGLKVVGKVTLDKHGNVVSAPEQQPAAPKAAEQKAPADDKPREEKAPQSPQPSVEKPEAVASPATPSMPKKEVTPAPEKADNNKQESVPTQTQPPVAPATPAPAPAPAPAPKPQQKSKENKESKESNKAVAPKPATAKPEVKPEKQEKPRQSAPEVKKPAEAKPEEKKAETPTAESPTTEEKKSEEVFRPVSSVAAPGFKVVGKIDLSTIKDPTRPKKKERSRGDRGKRKRIGQKVDIEQAVKQPGFGAEQKKEKTSGGGGGGQNKGGGRSGGGRNNERNGRGRAPEKRRQEVNTEDVQKQVKETLARLTTKTAKKAATRRKEKREVFHNREMENARLQEAESRVLKLTEFVTANDLAQMMDIPVNNVIATCMNLGVMVSINQRLDAETINIVADEFGFSTEYVSADVSEAIAVEEDSEEDLVARPPIVTVMGHVDHGKTSLLDYIRNANVIAGEAGGITQHIGAYNVRLDDGRRITFLDTPGHEAFTAMRARGAKVTDLAIIIVAADDEVMPQTVEAINHASAAGVPIVFAINKIDKPAANPEKIKEQLSAMNYLVEDWGGKYQSQDISAKKGIGVAELMEKVLLEAELLELKANPNRRAIGSIIESSLDKGRGYVATVLVQNGTLHVGDVVLAGTHYGKIRAMFNERNQRVKEARPATPVLVLGLNGAPTAGDTFNVMESEQEAREIASKREQLQREQKQRTKKLPGLDDISARLAKGEFHELNLVVKGDVDGSVEALSDSLIKLSTDKVQVNVLHKGVGAISESDVTLAAASGAIIIGFQVRPSGAARREAEKDGVEIRLYSVIYKAIEEVQAAMEGLLEPEIREEITGTAEILQTYHISKVGTIAGCMVRDGRIKRGSKVRVIRDGIVIYTGDLASLKRFKDDVKDVVSGYECGMSVQGYNDLREGDMLEGFEEIAVKTSL